jgi:PAS domain S-box-containing protein
MPRAKLPLRSGKSRKKTNELKRFHIEENYRNIIDSISDGVFCLNTDGYVTVANKTITERLGIPAEQLHALHFLDVITPEYHEQAKKNFRRIMKGEDKIVSELKYKYSDGQARIVEVRSRPIREDGKVVGLLGISRDITARKQAEERLKNQMEFVTTLLDTIPSPVFYKDVSGRYLGCNHAFEEFLGRTRESIIGKSVYDVSSAEIAEKYEAMDNELFEHGDRQTYEWKARAADESEKDVIFNKATFPDASGNIAGLVGVILDITERKQAEEKLQEAHRRLDEIIEFLPDATFVIDTDSKVIAWNRAIEQMTRVSKAEMIGKGEYALPFYGERRPILIDLALLPDAEFEKRKYDISQRSADTIYGDVHVPKIYGGKGAYLSAAASRLRDAAGNIVGAIESIRDITGRIKTEESLRESEEKYRAIIENMQEGYHEVDLKGNFTFFNESMYRMLGYEREELLGMNYRQYADEENTRKVYRVYNRVYRTGESVKNFEWQIIRKDGDHRDIEVSISLIKDAEGHPTGFRGIVRDITERKLAEIELQASEDKFYKAFQANPSLMAIRSLRDGRFIDVNDA